MRSRSNGMLGIVLLFLLGIGALIAAAFAYLDTRAFIATAKTAPGRIVRFDLDTDNDHHTTYHTVFSFNDDSGRPHSIRTDYSQRPRPSRIGDRITVLYPPGLPESARIRSFSSFWLFPAVFGTLGLAFTIISSIAFFYARKKPHSAQNHPSAS